MPATRTMAKLSHAELIEGLIKALKEESVIQALAESLTAAICQPLKKEIEKLKDVIQEKEDKIMSLEEKIDNLEKCSRRNNLRIHGIPEKDQENLLSDIPSLLNAKLHLSPSLDANEICRVHRIGRPDKKPRPIIVKLISYQIAPANLFRSCQVKE